MRSAATVFVLCITPSLLWGQSIGIGGHVGTVGAGADAAIAINQRVAARGSINFFPVKPVFMFDDYEYEVDLPSPQFTLLGDLYVAGPLRVSAGVLISTPHLVATSDQSGSGSANIGGQFFPGSDVGTLIGTIMNKDVAPYVGLGLGRLARRGLSVFFDLGVAFHGQPQVTFEATGSAANNPVFQNALDQEAQQFEDDIPTWAKYYPVLSLGLSFGF